MKKKTPVYLTLEVVPQVTKKSGYPKEMKLTSIHYKKKEIKTMKWYFQ
jgi:hypothetical protein